MKYVYMLQSAKIPTKHYTGITADLKRRFADHNKAQSPYTKKFLPWRLVGYIAFSDSEKAKKFEAYLKTASGRTFAKRHF